MTSQIILLNRKGAAVASDSLGTVLDGAGEYVTSNTMQKVLEIGQQHKVLILNTDDGSITGTPLTSIVSAWNKTLEAEPLSTCWDYVDNFIDFVQEAPLSMFPEMQVKLRDFFYDRLRPLSEMIAGLHDGLRPFQEETLQRIRSDAEFTKKYRRSVSKTVNAFARELTDVVPKKFIADRFEIDEQFEIQRQVCKVADSDAIVDLWFPDEAILPTTKKLLKRSMWRTISGTPIDTEETLCRVTFVGYGQDDFFPTAFTIAFESKLPDLARWTFLGKAEVTSKRSDIYLLAQVSNIKSFVSGVHPDFLEQLTEAVPKAVVDDRRADYASPDDMDENEVEIWRDIGSSVHRKLRSYIDEFASNNERALRRTLDFMEPADLSMVAKSLVNLEILGNLSVQGHKYVGGKIVSATIDLSSGVRVNDPEGQAF